MTAPAGAVFLDRDGVLNRRPPPHTYVTDARDFRWLPGAAAAVARLTDGGLRVFVVSNQRGIARRLVTWDVLRAIEAEIQAELAARGSAVSGFLYCPHDEVDRCECRKPKPGLLRRAAAEYGVDLAMSVMIGDDESDVEAGRAAGAYTIRIGPPGTQSAAEAVAGTLEEAVPLATRAAASRAARSGREARV